MLPQLQAIIDREGDTHALIESMCAQVESADRNFSDAELTLIEGWKATLDNLKRQREPLEAIERDREAFEAARAKLGTPSESKPRTAALAVNEGSPWRNAGEFMRDYVGSFANELNGHRVNPVMAERIANYQTRASASQITTDTPGLLPEPVVGAVLTGVDDSRPFVNSIGAKSLVGVAGTTFNRPVVTQHTQVGLQTTELTQLPSQKMVITPVPFAKKTAGGSVLVSRQDIDWTDPSAWQILLDDLASMYAEFTDDVAADALATAVTQTTEVASDDLAGWIGALHAAVGTIMSGGSSASRLPNCVWLAPDAWGSLGGYIDASRISINPSATGAGSGGISTMNGTVLDVPRIMVPGLAPGTAIVGRTTMTEFYEQRIGVLQAVQPGILGVEVAYGGYIAYGTLDPTAFCKITNVTPLSSGRAAEGDDRNAVTSQSGGNPEPKRRDVSAAVTRKPRG